MTGRIFPTGAVVLALSLCAAGNAAAQFAPPGGNVPAGAPDPARKITVNIKETPFRDAVDLIFAGSGLQFAIGPEIENTLITLRLNDVSITQAVRLLVRQASVAQPGLRYEYRNGVFNFYRGEHPGGVTIHVPAGRRDGSPSSPAAWMKIELRHVNAASIGELLGAQVIKPSGAAADVRVAKSGYERTGWIVPEGIEGILALTADNSLIVRGTPESMQAMTSLLSLIDIPQRQSGVILNVGSLRAETLVGDAEEVSLLDSDGAGKLEARVSIQRGEGGLIASIDGQVRLNGRSRSFKTRRSVVPGVSIQIASVSDGKTRVPVTLKVQSPTSGMGGFGGGLGGFGGGGLGGGALGPGGLGGGRRF